MRPAPGATNEFSFSEWHTTKLSRQGMLRLVLYGALLLAALQYCMVAPQAGAHINNNKDFSHLWLGGRMIAAGHAAALYDPIVQERTYQDADPTGRSPAVWLDRNRLVGGFFYPPPMAVAYSTLAWLPMATAAVVLAYMNIVCGLVLAWLVARWLGSNASTAAIGLAILACPAFFVTVALGQNAVMTTGVIAVAWLLCDKRRDFVAGLILGLLICKPNWLVAIAWIPFIHGRWRLIAGMICGGAGIAAGTVLITGAQPFLDYLQVVRVLAGLHEMQGYELSLTYNGLSVFRKMLGVGRLADVLGWCANLIIILTTWRISRGAWQPGTVRFKWLMGCGLSAALWVNPHLFYYDLTLVSICVVLMALAWQQLSGRARLWAAAVVVLTYLSIPLDQVSPWADVLPLPSFATLAMWVWFCTRLTTCNLRPPLTRLAPCPT
jgi:hypothetical protein